MVIAVHSGRGTASARSPAGTMKEAAMSDDFFDRFAVLGEEPVGAGAAVDQGWLTKGLEANKLQSSLDVVLTFVDGAREGTNITDATLNGVVRAMFDEQQAARELRAELSRDSDIRTEPTVGSKPIDRLDRDGLRDLLDRRDFSDLLDRDDLDDLFGIKEPGDPLNPPIDFGDIDVVPLDEF